MATTDIFYSDDYSVKQIAENLHGDTAGIRGACRGTRGVLCPPYQEDRLSSKQEMIKNARQLLLTGAELRNMDFCRAAISAGAPNHDALIFGARVSWLELCETARDGFPESKTGKKGFHAFDANLILPEAFANNHKNIALVALESGATILRQSFELAISAGHVEICAMLIPYCNEKTSRVILLAAARAGKPELCLLIMPQVKNLDSADLLRAGMESKNEMICKMAFHRGGISSEETANCGATIGSLDICAAALARGLSQERRVKMFETAYLHGHLAVCNLVETMVPAKELVPRAIRDLKLIRNEREEILARFKRGEKVIRFTWGSAGFSF